MSEKQNSWKGEQKNKACSSGICGPFQGLQYSLEWDGDPLQNKSDIIFIDTWKDPSGCILRIDYRRARMEEKCQLEEQAGENNMWDQFGTSEDELDIMDF